MKRMVALLLTVAVLLCLCTAGAAASETTDAYRESTFSVSIYNDETQEYVLENKTFTASGITVFRTINLLKTRGLIADFTQGEKDLLEIHYYLPSPELEEESSGLEEEVLADVTESSLAESSEPVQNTALLRSNDVDRFYVKRNGQVITGNGLNQYMRDGDIIEWIYGIPPKAPASPPPPEENSGDSAPPAAYWNDTVAAAFQDACDWLNRNPNSASLYLTALGTAGKTAESKTVAELYTRAKTEYKAADPETLAQLALNLSYCGYDRSDPDMANLLSRLVEIPFTDGDGLAARAYTLLALDCRNYTVPNAAEHNRSALVSELLAFQKRNGGFPDKLGSQANVDSTALAIIALSPYLEQEEVFSALELALSYLSAVQLDSGNFKNDGRINCQSAAFVVMALCSSNSALNEERFFKDGKGPLEVLLDYFRADGGFSMTQDGGSTEAATEIAVIALSAVKRNGNPFQLPASLVTAPVVSPQEKIPESTPEASAISVYATVGGACLGAVILLVGALIWYLRRNRRLAKESAAKGDDPTTEDPQSAAEGKVHRQKDNSV